MPTLLSTPHSGRYDLFSRIKKTASPGKGDVRHCQALEKLKLPIGPGGVICLTEQPLPLTPSTLSIAVAAI